MTHTLVTRDDDILGGIAVFAGTRVPVKTLFDYLQGSYSLADFLDDFPTVTIEQAQQVIKIAERYLQTLGGEAVYEDAA